MTENRERLKQILLEKAIKFGDFTLASGQKSTYYINGKMATLDSEGLNLIAGLFLDMIENLECDAIGGMSLGADPIIGAMIALGHNRGRHLAGLIIRKDIKDHGTMRLIEGPAREGMKVVVVEDVSTTGGSASKAIDAIKASGCDIVKVMTIVDREQGAKEHFAKINMRFESIFSKKDLGL